MISVLEIVAHGRSLILEMREVKAEGMRVVEDAVGRFLEGMDPKLNAEVDVVIASDSDEDGEDDGGMINVVVATDSDEDGGDDGGEDDDGIVIEEVEEDVVIAEDVIYISDVTDGDDDEDGDVNVLVVAGFSIFVNETGILNFVLLTCNLYFVHWSTVQYSTVLYSTVLYSTVQYRTDTGLA